MIERSLTEDVFKFLVVRPPELQILNVGSEGWVPSGVGGTDLTGELTELAKRGDEEGVLARAREVLENEAGLLVRNLPGLRVAANVFARAMNGEAPASELAEIETLSSNPELGDVKKRAFDVYLSAQLASEHMAREEALHLLRVVVWAEGARKGGVEAVELAEIVETWSPTLPAIVVGRKVGLQKNEGGIEKEEKQDKGTGYEKGESRREAAMKKEQDLMAAAREIEKGFERQLGSIESGAAFLVVSETTDEIGNKIEREIKDELDSGLGTLSLSGETIKSFSESTRKILENLGLDLEQRNADDVSNRIRLEAAKAVGEGFWDAGTHGVSSIGSNHRLSGKQPTEDTNDVAMEFAPLAMRSEKPPTLPESALPDGFWDAMREAITIRPVGIGDLKVVRQTLREYRLGEVAHIENVMATEKRKRKHRDMRRSEETIFVEEENSSESENSFETAERFELSRESEKTIERDSEFQAGATVSASYGPVKATTSANFATSNARSESKRVSSQYAQDITRRSLEKIEKRTLKRRTTTNIHEAEELNVHGFDNTQEGAKNKTGIYRWVDKVYDAQIFNYGQRMMFEFTTPEPAAVFKHMMDNRSSEGTFLEKPRPLHGLLPSMVTKRSYGAWIARYGVTGVDAPPSNYKYVSKVIDVRRESKDDWVVLDREESLEIPDGYESTDAWFHGYVIGSKDETRLTVTAGGLSWTAKTDETSKSKRLNVPMVGPVTLGMLGNDVIAASIAVVMRCRPTSETLDKWQLETYGKIVDRHDALKSAYEEELRVARVEVGSAIRGNNPMANKATIDNELKRSCLELMIGRWSRQFFSMSGVDDNGFPEINRLVASSEKDYVQFFEQAFEWEQMTYLFYPYFWARQSEWVGLNESDDIDPAFKDFLKAGSARVLIPARPGFRDTILYFVETGLVWSGGSAPKIDDPYYLSLAEQTKAKDDPKGEPEGKSWEVRIPTPLIALEASSGEELRLPSWVEEDS